MVASDRENTRSADAEDGWTPEYCAEFFTYYAQLLTYYAGIIPLCF